MQALTAPARGSLAFGTLLLAVAAVTPSPAPRHRLTLHAPERANEIYLTVFDDGPIFVALPAQRETLQFETRVHYLDHCDWLGRETLVPLDDHRFAYSYDEVLLACEPGAKPTTKTPRQGLVVVDF